MDKIFELFDRKMVPPGDIIEEAIKKNSPRGVSPEYIKENFSRLVEKLQEDAYSLYLCAQKQYGEEALKEYLSQYIKPAVSVDEFLNHVAGEFEELNSFFLSLSQSRKARAGKAFEIIIKTLVKKLNYPFDEQVVINGKPDFLMPSKKHYERNPMECIIFTAKRTVRERWRQIVTEGTRGLGFFLATIDEEISDKQLNEMLGNRIYLVLPASIKGKVAHYKKADNVISFEEFFERHLDPAMANWKRRGIIK